MPELTYRVKKTRMIAPDTMRRMLESSSSRLPKNDGIVIAFCEISV